MVAAAFVAPYLMEATARFVADAAALPGVRLGLITCDPLERIEPSLRDQLSGHWRVENALDPRQVAEAVTWARSPDGPGGAPRRRARAAPGAACPGARGHGDRGHGRADRPQRARQVADEGRAPRGRGALRRARSGHGCRRGDCVRAGGRLPVGRQAAGRRRLAGDLPARRRRVARRLAAQRAAQRRAAGPARGVPRRRGAHLRQRHDRWQHRVVLDRRLPATAAGGPAQPLDPVDGGAPARHLRTRVRRHPPDRPGRAAVPSASATRSPTWSGSAGRTARWPSRRSRPDPREPS